MDYESEQSLTRDEAATALREIADGVAAGSLLVGADEATQTVAVPETVAFELEVEREGDDREIEIELEWSEQSTGDAADAEDALEESDRAATEGESEEVGSETAERSEEWDSESTESIVESGPLPVGPAKPPRSFARFELFRDRGGEWRWRLRHRNGNVIATSGEAYTRKHNAKKGLRSVMQNASGAETIEESDH